MTALISRGRLAIGAVLMLALGAGCGGESGSPEAETTTTTEASTTTTTVATTTSTAATTSMPSDAEIAELEDQIRADVIAGHEAYWEFLTSGDPSIVEPYVDEELYNTYVSNLSDLEENGLFRPGFDMQVDVPVVDLTDDLSAAVVRYCYVSDQDLVQVNDAGEETTGIPANEPYGVVKRVALGEDGVWKTTFGTPRGLFGAELEEACAGLLGG